jgi:hypothetical protein
MTVIAWDGKTLAADRRCMLGNTIRSTTKIFRVFGELVGVSGDYVRGLEVLAWFRAGAVPADFPTPRGTFQGNLLVISASGKARRYEEGPIPYMLEDVHAAAGCGDESALVAMHLGATAREAVEITSRFNYGCGNGVDTLTLEY